jgi:cation transport ATPase
VTEQRKYEQMRRTFVLAGINMHTQQRASTVLFTGTTAPTLSWSLFTVGVPSAFAVATTSSLMTGTTPSLRKTW